MKFRFIKGKNIMFIIFTPDFNQFSIKKRTENHVVYVIRKIQFCSKDLCWALHLVIMFINSRNAMGVILTSYAF